MPNNDIILYMYIQQNSSTHWYRWDKKPLSNNPKRSWM